MRTVAARIWLLRFALVVVCVGVAISAAAGEGVWKVLMIRSFGGEFEPYKTFSESFRSALSQQSPEGLDILDVALASARLEEGSREGPFVEYLNSLYAEGRPDLIVTIGAPAAKFAQRNRQRLFESTPVLYTGVDRRFVVEAVLTDNETVVGLNIDAGLAIRNILTVLPGTTNIAVVLGASPLELFWTQEIQSEVQDLTNRVHFAWLNELPFGRILGSVAKLPPSSAIFYGVYSVDGLGIPYEEQRALTDLRAAAKAPIFGLHDFQLGRGIVGGALMPLAESSLQSAQVALRILLGERPGAIKTEPLAAGLLAYDWRELKRWGIAEDRLPRGSEVRFRGQSFLQRHGWKIFVVASVVLLQAGIIVLLLKNRAKRRVVEHALRESEARFRTVANAAPVMIWMSGRDKLCTFFNKSWLDFTGRTLEQEVGNGWAEGVHKDDLQGCLSIYTSSFDERKSFTMEYRLRRQDGEYRWISDTGVPRYDDLGRFAGYIGSCLDISDSKRKGEALMESEGRLRAILDTAAEGIITINENGIIESVNAATVATFGYPADELIGRDVTLLMPASFRKEQESDVGVGQELTGTRKNGTEVPLELAVSETRLADRFIYTCFVRDVSERKSTERTARELSGRLIRAQEDERARLARELHDDITQRLARLAIDAGLAERGGSAGFSAETLRAVREGLVRVSEDVHSLSYRLHPQMLEDLGLTAALKAECERFAKRESVSAELKTLSVPDPLAMETSLCLFRVTQEALRNVGLHARARNVEIIVRGLDGGVQLAVHDDGIGFNTVAGRSRATLGQASMRERVRLLKGEFDIESVPGHGTTVVAWVPVNGGSK